MVTTGAAVFAAMSGTDPATFTRERPGMSAFALEAGIIYHTYSTYARGVEMSGGSYHMLDLTACGRQEDWEEPKGRAAGGGLPPRPDLSPYPDEYEG